MKKRKLFLFLTFIGIVGAGIVVVSRKIPLFRERQLLPSELPYASVLRSPSPTTTYTPLPVAEKASGTVVPTPSPTAPPSATPQTLTSTINLKIPFTVQAPYANWDPPYKEFCEEASVLMAASYIRGEDIPNADYADTHMRDIQAFEEQRFGYYEDASAEEVAIILREYYNISAVDLLIDPTTEDIRRALSQRRAVIVPAAGRLLQNPHFRQPGPLYHMLVIKGFTANGMFITNDPGTRYGADYLYDEKVIMNALGDWNGSDVDTSRKVIIIVG